MGITIFLQLLLIFDSYHYWQHFDQFYSVFSLILSLTKLLRKSSLCHPFFYFLQFQTIFLMWLSNCFFFPPLQSSVFIPNLFSSDCVDFFIIIQYFFVYYLRLFTRNWKEINLSYPIFMACIPLWLRDFRNSSTLKGMWRWVNV